MFYIIDEANSKLFDPAGRVRTELDGYIAGQSSQRVKIRKTALVPYEKGAVAYVIDCRDLYYLGDAVVGDSVRRKATGEVVYDGVPATKVEGVMMGSKGSGRIIHLMNQWAELPKDNSAHLALSEAVASDGYAKVAEGI